MNDPIVGKKVNGYRIQEVLGRGGMGVVYKAEEIPLSRSVALKRLNPKLAGDESFLRRFRTEAQAIARIDSPYIVQIYTLSETEIGLVIVMEYVKGWTLKQRIATGEVSWEESIPLIQQMLKALQHAHGTEVIHRDIKPQNILLPETSLVREVQVKMTDFGLAKVNTTEDPHQTVTQGIYGTLPYVSPEQVEGKGEIDYRSDIYSLGMTCYEMLAGRLPFEEESTEYTIMRKIVEGDLPELGTFAPEVPDKLREVVMTALAKVPSERFEDATEMQNALERFEASPGQGSPDRESTIIPTDLGLLMPDSLTPGAPGESMEESPSVPSGRAMPFERTFWHVAGAGVVLALVLGAGWYFVVGSSASRGELQQEAVAVERDTAEGTASNQDTSFRTLGGKTDSSRQSSEEVLEEIFSIFSEGAPTEQQDSDARPSGGKASGSQSEQSTGDQQSERRAAEQAANPNVADERDSAKAADSEGTDASENQEELRKNLPSPIARLLGIEDADVLDKHIADLEKSNQLSRGRGPEVFFRPDECYVFIVEDKKVKAVLGPETEGARINLLSGRKVKDWRSRYRNDLKEWVYPILTS